MPAAVRSARRLAGEAESEEAFIVVHGKRSGAGRLVQVDDGERVVQPIGVRAQPQPFGAVGAGHLGCVPGRVDEYLVLRAGTAPGHVGDPQQPFGNDDPRGQPPIEVPGSDGGQCGRARSERQWDGGVRTRCVFGAGSGASGPGRFGAGSGASGPGHFGGGCGASGPGHFGCIRARGQDPAVQLYPFCGGRRLGQGTLERPDLRIAHRRSR
ncbi:hypothetical protein C6V83_17800 [Gordonia iterans]|uniref:Uncharacterized protein n=1 Tax=Gordonia iterans TaxID=1004901 RepID=A0A2S0KJI4_9ACTN|nr:hypothetical protein C6V83_17800 [Gordonia iterans]